MIRVSMLPTQGIFTRTCAGSLHGKFASSTGAAECLDGVAGAFAGPTAWRREPAKPPKLDGRRPESLHLPGQAEIESHYTLYLDDLHY